MERILLTPDHILDRFSLRDADLIVTLQGEEYLPPSINKMYKAIGPGQMILRPEGIAYFNKFSQAVSTQLMMSPIETGPWVYTFTMVVFYETLISPGYVKEAERFLAGKSEFRKKAMRTVKRKAGKVKKEVSINVDLMRVIDADGPLKHVQDKFFNILGIKDHWALASPPIKSRSSIPGLELFLTRLPQEDVLYQLNVSEEVLAVWLMMS